MLLLTVNLSHPNKSESLGLYFKKKNHSLLYKINIEMNKEYLTNKNMFKIYSYNKIYMNDEFLKI